MSNVMKRIFKLLANFIRLYNSIRRQNSWVYESRDEYFRFMNVIQMFNFRLVQDFSEIFQPILMLHFLWNIAALCITLLILQIAIVFIQWLISKKQRLFNSSFSVNCSHRIRTTSLRSYQLCSIYFGHLLWSLFLVKLGKGCGVNSWSSISPLDNTTGIYFRIKYKRFFR